MLEGLVGLGAGASLLSLLSTRKSYVNLTEARWSGSQRSLGHLVLRVSQVVWAGAPNGDVPLLTAPLAVSPTQTELQLEGGMIVRGGLPLAPRQRLGDYLESAGPFIPLHDAVLLRSRAGGKPVGAALGEIAVNQSLIEAAWEAPSSEAVPATAEGESATPTED